jgi:hypothetical protein
VGDTFTNLAYPEFEYAELYTKYIARNMETVGSKVYYFEKNVLLGIFGPNG